MKSVSINGIARVNLGKKFAKQLRKEDNVPCVIYGGKDEPVHFYAHENEFRKIIYTPNVYLIDITIGDQKLQTIIRDIQFHPVTDKILHIDFYQLFEDKPVIMNIPVRLVGNSKGVSVGGALRHNVRKMKVKALPANLPDFIEADITELEIGNKLYVTALKNDNFTIMHPDNTVVAQVRMSRNAAKAAADAE